MTKRRPNPFQWIAYSFGRKLPASMNDWVLNDLKGPYAVPRHMIRSMVPFVPIFAAFFLFPGPLWLNCSMVLLAVLLAVFFAACYMEPNRVRRLAKHGLDTDLRTDRQVAEEEQRRLDYSQRYPH